MIKQYSKLFATALLFSPVSLFAQVNNAQIIPFQAGTPARAADMNQNINELIRAINENTAQLQLLRNQMTIITSGSASPQYTLQQNLAGSVFKIGVFETAQGTSSTRTGLTEIGILRQLTWGESATLTLNANNTAVYSLTAQGNQTQLFINSGFDAADPANPFPLIMDADVSTALFPESETLNGSWSLAGNVLSLDFGDGIETLCVSVDGNALFSIGTEANNEDPNITLHDVSMDVGVRVSKTQPNIYVFKKASTQPEVPESPYLNDGTQYVKAASTFVLSIRNTGTSDLVVSNQLVMRTAGNYDLGITSAQLVIAPGQEQDVTVTDSVAGGQNSEASVYLMSNDPDTPVYVVNIKSDY